MRGGAWVLAAVLVSGCAGTPPEGDGPAATGPTASASSGYTAGTRPSPTPSSRTSSTASSSPSPSAAPAQPDASLSELAAAAQKHARKAPRVTGPVLGADLSWPQCPRGMGIPERRTLGMPMPLRQAEYVVIGLTNGPGFTPNPCLGDQTAWARERRLMVAAYAVASFPNDATLARHRQSGPYDGTTRLGALRNTGYEQALFNVASMREAALETPVVWIDVEPVPDFDWSDDLVANAAVIEGAARAYRDSGYRIGVYSTPSMWKEVVGGFTLGGVPEWRPAGMTSAQEALGRCGRDWSIQGGPGVMGQWVEERRDQNLTCPGVDDLSQWFHQY